MKHASIFALLVAALLVVSCSKERQLEKWPTKKNGEWNIDTAEWETTTQGLSGQVVETGTSTDVGTFTFDNGSGSYDITINGKNYSQSFTWISDNEAITISYASQSLDITTGLEQIAVLFTGDMADKKSMTLSGSESVQIDTGQDVLTATFELSRK